MPYVPMHFKRGKWQPGVAKKEDHFSERFLEIDGGKLIDPAQSAIKRKKMSRPMWRILHSLVGKRVFHQGPGRKRGPDRRAVWETAESWVQYDPGWGPKHRNVLRLRDCDVGISFYVFNVIPPEFREEALLDLALSVTENGEAYVALRGLRDLANERHHKWERYGNGYLVPHRGQNDCYLEFFDEKTMGEMLAPYWEHCDVLHREKYLLAKVTYPKHYDWEEIPPID